MVERAFLKPRSVELPSQGDFRFKPIIRLFEADTAAGLEAAMNADMTVQQTSTTHYYVIEDVEYQVKWKPPPMGEWRYSALVWGTEVEII